MTSLIVNGGRALRGRIIPSANKNAVLPVLCATLLTDQPVTLHRVPDITDVRKILDFFRNLGSTVDMDFAAGTLRVRHGVGLNPKAAHLPLGMRSTLMLIPPLLHRFGAATIEEDATGCTLGAREIDPHIEVLQTFGATVRREP
ncbi:MAG: UDP-N-acetylglucosamine 1-carboxyvinyltransferase, partial [Phenylobacterium sp.]|nr:UDP-N-acetylglucosamine 1-carboxyvinyltransferase [Phenylobacterium sp.]